MLRQDTKKDLLMAIEETLCTDIEVSLEKRAKQLPDANYDELVAEYMSSPAVRKFLLRCQSRFPDFAPNITEALVKEYITSQIDWVQSVKMEQDIITISQYLRKYFGLEASVSLLENIHDAAFDLNAFMSKYIDAAKLKQSENSQLPSIFDNQVKFQQMDNLIKRLRNFYMHIDIKRQYYNTPALQKETAYQTMQESLMWVDGQRLTCITGMKFVASENIHSIKMAGDAALLPANALQGARAHLENTIGMYIADELFSMTNVLTEKSVDEIVSLLKSKDAFALFARALGNGTRAGFNTFLPHANLSDLNRLIDEYLATSIHLAQSIMYERNVLRISQYVRRDYGIETAKKLLTEIEMANFNMDTLLKDPRRDMRVLIEGLHQFYIYADIKKQDSFFEKDEPQAKKLFESEMWISLQRHFCIQGMSLIQSGAAYQDKKITFTEEVQAVIAESMPAKALPVAAIASSPAEVMVVAASVQSPSNTKKPTVVRKPSMEKMPQRNLFDWSELQGGISEEEAIAEALRQSKVEAKQDAELNAALLRSRADQKQVELPQKQTPKIVEEKRDHYGRTPLMISCAEGEFDTVKALVESGADIQAVNQQSGRKPIHYAAKYPHIIKYLISKGASIMDRTSNQQTALAISGLDKRLIDTARAGEVDSLLELINDFNIPVDDCRDDYQNNALHAATKAGKLDMVKCLVEVCGMDIHVGIQGYKAIHYAASKKHFDIMAFLISKGASPLEITGDHKSAHTLADLGDLFIAAARTGDIQTLQYYIDALKVPVDIRNAYNKTALMVAAECGKIEVMRLLVEQHNANINMKGTQDNKAIHYAAIKNQQAAMAYLISKGASSFENNSQNKSAHTLADMGDLFVDAARKSDHVAMTYMLNELKVPVDIRNSYYKTALMVAAEVGRLASVRFLVEECQANLQVTGAQNFKAIHYAAQKDHEEIVAYFIKQGVSPTDVVSHQHTAISLLDINEKFINAARRGEVAAMKRYLDDFKIAATVTDQRYKTALMVACEYGKIEAVKFLVEECRVPLDTKCGNSRAIDMADRKHHEEIVAFLVQHGAEPLPTVVAQAPAVVMLVPRAEPLPANVFSVLADALVILERLQGAAKLRENEKDDADSPSYGTSDAEDERYGLNHGVLLNRDNTNLPLNRFHAACQLLESCMHAVRCDTEGFDEHNNPLEMWLMHGTTCVSISASHNRQVLQRKLRSFVRMEDYPAPIALFPFDKLKKAVMNLLATCFTDWSVDIHDPHKLMKRIHCDRNSYNTLVCAFYHLQDVCKELDKGFSLDLSVDDYYSNLHANSESILTVNRASLEQAKKLLGYKSAFKAGVPPTQAEMLMATSPIFAREENRSVEKSNSMGFKM